MSWDVLLLRLPAGVTAVQDIPDGFSPPPMGWTADVVATLRATVPDVDLTDPAWGELPGPTWNMELNIGSSDPVDSIMLHIRGYGDDVLDFIARIAHALGCDALDISTGGLVTAREVTGWHGFQAYRDRVVGADE
ncbi:hypothetical protein [Streptomyces sp. NPDC048111]|uniref:hypothetical protein n=1 Tax=Streptomyces sp. NPDC048111 TaxID=3365500 RepID=UPI0037152B48